MRLRVVIEKGRVTVGEVRGTTAIVEVEVAELHAESLTSRQRLATL